jgi:hypothetical protein
MKTMKKEETKRIKSRLSDGIEESAHSIIQVNCDLFLLLRHVAGEKNGFWRTNFGSFSAFSPFFSHLSNL